MGSEDALVLAPGKVRCSPASPCSLRCAWLRVAPRLPSPVLRARAKAQPGRDGKAGLPVEPESRDWDKDAWATPPHTGCGLAEPYAIALPTLRASTTEGTSHHQALASHGLRSRM